MKIIFIKNHSHESANWAQGQKANVLKSFAAQWIAQGIAKKDPDCGCPCGE